MVQILGDQENNILEGTTENDTILGLAGNDTLNGSEGNDILQGSSLTTAGEIDILTGGTGSDTFVLGTPAKVFYDDGNNTTDGTGDYALITDFNPNVDVIQLGWSKDNYILGAVPEGLPEGTAIFLDKPGDEPDELIAIVQGVTGLDLNQSYFGVPSLSAVELSDIALDTDNRGFAINGEAAGDRSGGSVSNAGDVNGDGFDDLIIGASGADPNGSGSGKSYVVFGKADGTAVNLSAVTAGIGGFAINGEAAGDGSGASVSSAGDVNGDGLDDLIVGAPNADPNGTSSGKSYVVFGKADSASVNLSDVASGIGGFALAGEAQNNRSGFSVSDAGDVNGDGKDDLIIGTSSAQKSYVVFGKADSTAVSLSDVAAGTGGFVISGSGRSVSSAGDVNGDGKDDLIIGDRLLQPDGSNSGQSYVVFGKADGTAVSLSNVAAGTGGFVINGEPVGNGNRPIVLSDFSVSSAGDVNGDGKDDLIVGSRSAYPNGTSSGKSYVVFGKADGTAVELNDVAVGTGGFAINGEASGDLSGISVSRAGDINGDGKDDLIIGAVGANPNGESSGKSYVVFGKTDGTSVELSAVAAGIGGFALNGEAENDQSGRSVSGAGDVNNDGFDDLIVGVASADLNGESSGKSYVVFGGDFLASEPVANENNLASVLLRKPLVIPAAELLKWNPDNVLTVTEVSNAVGGTVSLVDGVVTFQAAPGFVGVATFDYTVNDSIDGTVTATASLSVNSTVELSDVALNTNASGFVINGEAAGDYSGWSVSDAGDVNGDGKADLIVGSAGSLFSGTPGKSYVVFGKTDSIAVNLSEVTSGIGGFAINGEAAGDNSGFSVSGAGDVNGDGKDDLIVGAFGADPNGDSSGKSYVVFGKTDSTAVELSDVASGIGGFVLNGEAGNGVGFSVSGAGDVNGDGKDDLIVNAPGANADGSGKSYVVFGKADNSSVEVSDVAAGISGFAINGETAGDNSGFSVSDAGDVNGDGLADLIVGASGADPNGESSGKSYVVFGKADGTAVELSDVASGIGGFVLNGEAAGDEAGISVSSAGDVNGDGLADLIVGAQGADPNGNSSGKSYVVFGKADGGAVNLSNVAAGNGGFVINGEGQSSISGGSVSSAGDVNGDGLDDLIVGTNPLTAIGVLAAIAGSEPVPTFKSYVVFGQTDGSAVELSDVAAGVGGFALEKDYLSSDSVSGAGDVNGDGFDDVIVGTPFTDPNGNVLDNSGQSYVVYGGDFTGTVTQQGGTGDDLLTGTAAADVIVAGQGNDTLIGNGGSDILYGGAGDDVITITDLNFNRIKGGSGIDTMRVEGSGMFFDLRASANNRITGIEQIDLNNSGSNALAFDKLDILALSDTNQLVILGNTSDVVVSLGQGWQDSGTQTLDGNLYNEYAVGGVSLLVDSDISHFIS